jgi:hypothetical protein
LPSQSNIVNIEEIVKISSLSQALAMMASTAIGVYFGVTLAISQHNSNMANAQAAVTIQSNLENNHGR